MNCIIIDDEPLARAEMQALIEDVSTLDILGVFSNVPTALFFLKEHEVDLVFLDIEMPMITGLELARQLPAHTLAIFTTAYPQYALDSYSLDAIDYLLKPIDKGRLQKAVKKAELYQKLLSDHTAKNIVEGNTSEFLLIKSDRKFYKINFSDIRYIEGLKDYVVIHTTGQKLITAMNLKTIHSRIPAEIFLRTSKSYVVNHNFITAFDHRTVYVDDSEIPLGDVYKRDFFSAYSGGSLNLDE
jgi:DNA-binding LytR/AlgR family response regulator